MTKGRPPERFRTSELGPEARCSKCRDWWPIDREFFYFQNDGKPHSWCKACYVAWRNAKRRADKNHLREKNQPAATGTTPTVSRSH